MDDELRQRYARAQAVIDAERKRQGIPYADAPRRPFEDTALVQTDRCGTLADSLTGFLAQLEARVMRNDADRDADAETQRARDRAQLQDRIRALKLPITAADERRLVAGELVDTKFLRNVRTWLATDRPWIVLSGPVGRGKTIAAGEACARERRKSYYVGARELERIFTARYGDEVEQQRALIECRGVLVIDDVGRERDAGGMTAALRELVDGRRGRGAKSIAITNLSVEQFQQRYPDERLWSRITECAAWVTDRGPDMRRKPESV